LINQSALTDILIVNNASTDGTEQELQYSGLLDEKRIHYIYLNQNTGGAGGFHYGLKYAVEKGWRWFWLMDDDAEPRKDALEKLIRFISDHKRVYGSVAVGNLDGGNKLCFPIKKISNLKTEIIEDYNKLGNAESVAWLPFLGFFIHKDTIEKIGLPDKNFFIRNDDLEYGERARRHGVKIFLVKDSIIEHPLQPTIKFFLFGRPIYHRSMPSWKMYYEVRNKIIIAKRHYTFFPALKSFAGVSFQVVLSILLEKNKSAYLKSYIDGIKDGFNNP
jgi:GT2 family glycosyltransferase